MQEQSITDYCWLWISYVGKNGYGYFGRQLAHRVSYETHKGPIPIGLDLDHLCRVRRCINPDHLEPVTRRENARRGIKGVLTTHCPQGHEYSLANTRLNNGRRICKTCHRAREHARYHATHPNVFQLIP